MKIDPISGWSLQRRQGVQPVEICESLRQSTLQIRFIAASSGAIGWKSYDEIHEWYHR